jgi:hypothetical protein
MLCRRWKLTRTRCWTWRQGRRGLAEGVTLGVAEPSQRLESTELMLRLRELDGSTGKHGL